MGLFCLQNQGICISYCFHVQERAARIHKAIKHISWTPFLLLSRIQYVQKQSGLLTPNLSLAIIFPPHLFPRSTPSGKKAFNKKSRCW